MFGQERALELGGEGIRKYDLIRWNLLAAALRKQSQYGADVNKYNNGEPYIYGRLSFILFVNFFTIVNVLLFCTTSDNKNIGGLWYNSLYKTAPTATPSGTTKVTWLGSAINTTCAARYATGYVTGKGELLPLPQPAIDANPNLRPQNPDINFFSYSFFY
ncbi:MAG: RagB/SusD family nutrient uptake outer membrane protein [Chitinophagaceae bacterium]|nr:RagB/SusD family nutrient uptake outer membrane protein [Chitinophagaceae bacterium]